MNFLSDQYHEIYKYVEDIDDVIALAHTNKNAYLAMTNPIYEPMQMKLIESQVAKNVQSWNIDYTKLNEPKKDLLLINAIQYGVKSIIEQYYQDTIIDRSILLKRLVYKNFDSIKSIFKDRYLLDKSTAQSVFSKVLRNNNVIILRELLGFLDDPDHIINVDNIDNICKDLELLKLYIENKKINYNHIQYMARLSIETKSYDSFIYIYNTQKNKFTSSDLSKIFNAVCRSGNIDIIKLFIKEKIQPLYFNEAFAFICANLYDDDLPIIELFIKTYCDLFNINNIFEAFVEKFCKSDKIKNIKKFLTYMKKGQLKFLSDDFSSIMAHPREFSTLSIIISSDAFQIQKNYILLPHAIKNKNKPLVDLLLNMINIELIDKANLIKSVENASLCNFPEYVSQLIQSSKYELSIELMDIVCQNISSSTDIIAKHKNSNINDDFFLLRCVNENRADLIKLLLAKQASCLGNIYNILGYNNLQNGNLSTVKLITDNYPVSLSNIETDYLDNFLIWVVNNNDVSLLKKIIVKSRSSNFNFDKKIIIRQAFLKNSKQIIQYMISNCEIEKNVLEDLLEDMLRVNCPVDHIKIILSYLFENYEINKKYIVEKSIIPLLKYKEIDFIKKHFSKKNFIGLSSLWDIVIEENITDIMEWMRPCCNVDTFKRIAYKSVVFSNFAFLHDMLKNNYFHDYYLATLLYRATFTSFTDGVKLILCYLDDDSFTTASDFLEMILCSDAKTLTVIVKDGRYNNRIFSSDMQEKIFYNWNRFSSKQKNCLRAIGISKY